MVIVGMHEEPFEFDLNILISEAPTITTSAAKFSEAFELIRAGRVKSEQVVTHAFPLDKIDDGFEAALNTQESIKVMIER